MSETATTELDPELKARLCERGIEGNRKAVIVEELLDEVEYLERVTGIATDDYY